MKKGIMVLLAALALIAALVLVTCDNPTGDKPTGAGAP
jgi:hypothetical protein